jgi:predicted NAD/FAD-binding protein
LDDYLHDDVFGTWCRMLLMYGYSTPYELTGQIGASLAVPTLRRFVFSSDWSRIVGGVWTYVERILERLRGRVITASVIEAVKRTDDGVSVAVAGAGTSRFDAVVFAVTPDRVLALLADATAEERRRFAAWRSHTSRTVVHRDTGMYERRGMHYFSEFDLFATPTGAHGYNAYLNRLCGIGDDAQVHYSLAFGLEEEIDPACVLHEQTHVSPSYDVAGLSRRHEVIAANGENHVWYAGAWLGDGLHEGAVQSAEQVSRGLGGRLADGASTPGAGPGERNRR